MRCLNRKIPGSGFRAPGSVFVAVSAALFAAVLTTAVFAAGDDQATPAKPAAQAKPATPAPAAPAAAQAPKELPKGYVGSETCATCHTGYDTSINATKHGQAMNPRTPAAKMGCET